MLIGQAHHLKQIIQKLNVELTGVSLLQLGTAKLFAYAEVTKSELNKISEIFPIFINLTSFSRFAVMISKLNSKFFIQNRRSYFRNRLIAEFQRNVLYVTHAKAHVEQRFIDGPSLGPWCPGFGLN